MPSTNKKKTTNDKQYRNEANNRKERGKKQSTTYEHHSKYIDNRRRFNGIYVFVTANERTSTHSSQFALARSNNITIIIENWLVCDSAREFAAKTSFNQMVQQYLTVASIHYAYTQLHAHKETASQARALFHWIWMTAQQNEKYLTIHRHASSEFTRESGNIHEKNIELMKEGKKTK